MLKCNILTIIVLIILSNKVNTTELYKKNGNRLDFYGKIANLYSFSKRSTINSNQRTYTRLGFKGETQIKNQLIGYGQWEYDLSENNLEDNSTLQKGKNVYLAHLGLKIGDHNSFDYGYNYGIMRDVLNYTDILPENEDNVTNTTCSDKFFLSRINSVITYRNTNFFGILSGLDFGIQYLKGKRTKKHNTQHSNFFNHYSNRNGFGVSLSYRLNGLSIIGAYGIINCKHFHQNNSHVSPIKTDTAKQWATSLQYEQDNVYLVASYGEFNAEPINKNFVNKTQSILLEAEYQFNFGLRPSIAYTQSKMTDMKNYKNQDLKKYLEIGVVHHFNKKMFAHLNYKIDQIGNKNKLIIDSDSTQMTFGIAYQF